VSPGAPARPRSRQGRYTAGVSAGVALADRLAAEVERVVVDAGLAPARGAGAPLGVACSGGADSLLLADVAIAAFGPGRVVVIHVDHQLQPGSADVAAAVAAWARGRGAQAEVVAVQVAPGASLEASARAARYRALDEVGARRGLAVILTGHSRTDLAETVVLRLLRGSGPPGLGGIPPVRGRYRRPWLGFDRAELAAHASARGLPVMEDPMNTDQRLARVRVRTELMPRLRAESPGLDLHLARLAHAMAEWTAVIDQLASPHLGPVGLAPGEVDDGPEPTLECARLGRVAPAIGKRVVQRAAFAAGLELGPAHLAAVWRLVRTPDRGTLAIDVPGGRAVREYGLLRFTRAGAPMVARAVAPLRIVGAGDRAFTVRPVRAGDRMRPARLRGRSRKLSDLFVDAKVPRTHRARARVVVDDTSGEIVWAEHLGLAHRASIRVELDEG
jgi:tRNA(Ile)-lysidine synthase